MSSIAEGIGSALTRNALEEVMGSRFRQLVPERRIGGPMIITNAEATLTISEANSVAFLCTVARLGPVGDPASREIRILSPKTEVTYDELGHPTTVTLQDPASEKKARISKEGVIFQF